MQDLFLLIVLLFFLSFGLVAPFVGALGYVWVDVFSPHQVSASLLVGQPISLIVGSFALITYVAADRKDPPRFSVVTLLQILLGVWITLTTTWAMVPDAAFARWDLAIKVLGFATFLPYVVRSRAQIEALMLVYLFSLIGHLIPWGLKTFLTGGGYDLALGLLHVNSNLLSESSTVSGLAIMLIPIILAMRGRTVLLPNSKAMNVAAYGLIALLLMAAVGSFARTALVAGGVMTILLWVRSRQKIRFVVFAFALGVVAFSVTSNRWMDRIDTISDYSSENSALVRVLVWQWGLNFLMSHPFGGGFWSFLLDRIETAGPNNTTIVQYGRAFHNVYVALLAEHGWPGFFLYMGMLGGVLLKLQKTQKLLRNSATHAWCFELARALQIAIITIYSAGMFVEIGWSPILWYLLSIAVALREYARRVTSPAFLAGQGAAVAPGMAPGRGLAPGGGEARAAGAPGGFVPGPMAARVPLGPSAASGRVRRW